MIFSIIGIIIIFIILSAFFSGSETALFSLKKSDLHRFSQSKSGIEKAISNAMADPQKLLITILVGNLFVNLIISTMSAKLLLTNFSKDYGHLISILIVTPLMVILCEISPKILSMNYYERISKKIFPFINFFHFLFFPIRLMILLFTGAIIKLFKLKLVHKKITEEELGFAISIGEKEGVIDKEEGNFIKNVMNFYKKEASNIMFPRNRSVFVKYGATVKEAMNILIKSNLVRAPVYREDLDYIVGMVDSKELLPYYMGYKKVKNINRFIKKIDFFPASKELNDLLGDFLTKKIQLAIVIDEYGGTAGVVTLKSILAELMGKEFSKWEADSKPDIEQVNENISIIRGEMQIDDFNSNFNSYISSINSDTIGGYIIEKLAHFPKCGEKIIVDEYILKIKSVEKNRIVSIEVIH